MDTAVRRIQQDILTFMFLTKAQSARIHLTASGSKKAGRYNINAVKPYQGNRTNKSKPTLLEPLRQAITLRENWLPEFDAVIMHHELEADDGMIIDAYTYKESGIIMSDDKDLRMTPYPYWCNSKGIILPSDPVGYVDIAYTGAGTAKCIGQGPMFFWAQMLMGDTADNIAGLARYNGSLCGPVLTHELLKDVRDINNAANLVIDGYRAIGQNVLAEGWLLWLLRHPTDSFWQYLEELDLTKHNRAYVNECATRDWFKQTN
jgi:hypothetical protein